MQEDGQVGCRLKAGTSRKCELHADSGSHHVTVLRTAGASCVLWGLRKNGAICSRNMTWRTGTDPKARVPTPETQASFNSRAGSKHPVTGAGALSCHFTNKPQKHGEPFGEGAGQAPPQALLVASRTASG